MITVMDTIGTPRRRHVYRDIRVEWKGFLSIFSFALDGKRRRLDAMRRTSDAVEGPVPSGFPGTVHPTMGESSRNPALSMERTCHDPAGRLRP